MNQSEEDNAKLSEENDDLAARVHDLEEQLKDRDVRDRINSRAAARPRGKQEPVVEPKRKSESASAAKGRGQSEIFSIVDNESIPEELSEQQIEELQTAYEAFNRRKLKGLSKSFRDNIREPINKLYSYDKVWNKTDLINYVKEQLENILAGKFEDPKEAVSKFRKLLLIVRLQSALQSLMTQEGKAYINAKEADARKKLGIRKEKGIYTDIKKDVETIVREILSSKKNLGSQEERTKEYEKFADGLPAFISQMESSQNRLVDAIIPNMLEHRNEMTLRF